MGEKAKILILGTYHFDNGGNHLINFISEDVTTDKKQTEINQVVQRLMEFKPNKIAVEAKKANEEELNKIYLQFCENHSVETNKMIGHRNEIVQIAFRLAQKLNHNRIYPVDVQVNLPEEVFEYAEKKCPSVYSKFIARANEYGLSENEFMQKHTVGEILRRLNNANHIEVDHSDLYLYLNQIGAGENYYGVNLLTEWYRRNLYIFSNLQSMAESGDRILVLYGAGHCKILRDFVKDYSEFEFVDPLYYL